MTELILSGVEWRVYDNLFWLRKQGVVPGYPWDIMKTGEEKLRVHDQGFGGEWDVMEREFVFLWDALPNTLGSIVPKRPTTLTLLMRGELPVVKGKRLESKEAQRRWFVGKLELESPTGRKVGEVEEVIALRAESKDDVMNLLAIPH